jgi:hypothetical protein
MAFVSAAAIVARKSQRPIGLMAYTCPPLFFRQGRQKDRGTAVPKSLRVEPAQSTRFETNQSPMQLISHYTCRNPERLYGHLSRTISIHRSKIKPNSIRRSIIFLMVFAYQYTVFISVLILPNRMIKIPIYN